jgi:hypothetical protein
VLLHKIGSIQEEHEHGGTFTVFMVTAEGARPQFIICKWHIT